jgi:hypothetical protein
VHVFIVRFPRLVCFTDSCTWYYLVLLCFRAWDKSYLDVAPTWLQLAVLQEYMDQAHRIVQLSRMRSCRSNEELGSSI